MNDRRAIAIRQTLAAGLVLLAGLFILGHCPGCALFTKRNANTVLDFVQAACVIENATLGDAKVAQICGIANELIPDLRRLLETQRAALAKARDEGEYGHPYRGLDAGCFGGAGAPVLDAGVPRLLVP